MIQRFSLHFQNTLTDMLFLKNSIQIIALECMVSTEQATNLYTMKPKILENDQLKAITIHLGNGASMAAVNENGESIDTTLGFRYHFVDWHGNQKWRYRSFCDFYMVEELGFFTRGENILNKESGMLYLGGSSDARDINEKCEQGDADAKLTLELYLQN